MRFPLTPELVQQAREYALRSACRDCLYWNTRRGECWHGWPDEGQRRWPLDGGGQDGEPPPTEAAFCKEFELR